MKYKKGQRIWCRCYSHHHDGELRYVGPAIIIERKWNDEYSVELPITLKLKNSTPKAITKQWLIKEEWIDHEI